MSKLIFTLLLCCSSAIAAENGAGFQTLSITAAHHSNKIEGAIWYPANNDGQLTEFAANPVFHGVTQRHNATIAEGRYPVVLLSHGLGGHLRTLSWLSAGLAEQGAVVIAVNHPASTFRDFDLQRGLQHWTRTLDLQAALDQVLDSTEFSRHLNPEQIYAAGFSYGGWTALSLGGLTGNLQGYAEHCNQVSTASTHCKDLKDGGANLQSIDPLKWNASYKDDRIKGVAAIDPALLHGLNSDNVTSLIDNVQLIALGEGQDRLFATDYSATGSDFEQLAPKVSTNTLAPASHFTALLTCKPAGKFILEDEGDDPVCTDPAGTDRQDIHQKIIMIIAKAFKL